MTKSQGGTNTWRPSQWGCHPTKYGHSELAQFFVGTDPKEGLAQMCKWKEIYAPWFLEFEELIEHWKRLWGSSNFTDKKSRDSERPVTCLGPAGIQAGEPALPKERTVAPSLHVALVLIGVPPQPLVVPLAKPGHSHFPDSPTGLSEAALIGRTEIMAGGAL